MFMNESAYLKLTALPQVKSEVTFLDTIDEETSVIESHREEI
jgi:hypothetical protein